MATVESFFNHFKTAPFNIISKFIKSEIPSYRFSTSAPSGRQTWSHQRPSTRSFSTLRVSFIKHWFHSNGLISPQSSSTYRGFFFPPSSLHQRIANTKIANTINVSWACWAGWACWSCGRRPTQVPPWRCVYRFFITKATSAALENFATGSQYL